eukprot:Skav207013  [mRNA]  locus=scaffold2740:31383:47098:- [translate_table: standard]
MMATTDACGACAHRIPATMKPSSRKAPVISLPKEAEHFVIHSDVGTPSAANEPQTRRISVSVRRRRSSDRKSSPGDQRRRTSPGKGAGRFSNRFSAVEASKHLAPCSGGRELSPAQEDSRQENCLALNLAQIRWVESQEEEKDGSQVHKSDVEASPRRTQPVPSEAAKADDVAPAASPKSLRKEIDVLRLQVQTLKDVQEQTAEIHWKVISNVVEERNLWEARYKEVTAGTVPSAVGASATSDHNGQMRGTGSVQVRTRNTGAPAKRDRTWLFGGAFGAHNFEALMSLYD